MQNIHATNAHSLSESQRKLLCHASAAEFITQFKPFRNADDADDLFDLLWLVHVGFLKTEEFETKPRQKLSFSITLAGRYARSLLKI